MATELYLKKKDSIKRYYLKNKEKIDAYRKDWYKRNKQSVYLKNKAYKDSRPEISASYQRKYRAKSSVIPRLEIVKVLGGKCVNCGYNTDFRALHIDHINGGGKFHRGKTTSSATYYKHIKESILRGDNLYQLLCCNCNWIKVYDNKERKNIGISLEVYKGLAA